MNREQTTSMVIVGMAVFATVITTSVSFVMPVAAVGHISNPDGLADFRGLPISDRNIDFKGILGKALESGSEGLPDGEDSSKASAVGGFPNDEMESADTPEQGSPTDDKASPPLGGDNSKGSLGSDNTHYEGLQECLSNIEVEGTPTEQQVQDCIGSSFGERDGDDNTPTDPAEGDEDENSVTEYVSTEDTEDGEDEDFE